MGLKRNGILLMAAATMLAGGVHAASVYTGTPRGVPAQVNNNSVGYPEPSRIPGQPVERRATEMPGNRPVFPGQTRAPYRATIPIQIATITDSLRAPWGMALLPGGRFLVTEKIGAMRIVGPDGQLSKELAGVPKVNVAGQVGLLDVALDRDFTRNKRVFISYSEPVGADASNIAVASATLDEAAPALRDLKVIYRVKPVLPNTLVTNNGGRIAVAADGNLFVTVGDRNKSPPWDMAQQMSTALGKIIRITPEGAAAPGNPFIGEDWILPEIWSVGHRSHMGLAFDARGRLWSIENGPKGGDELNLIEPGKNYGWPIISHGITYPGELINGGLIEKAGMEQPRYYWDPVIAPTNLAIYNGDLFPQWKGNVLVGSMRGTQLVRLTLADDKVVDEEPLLFDLKSRVRDVRVGPEGAVYVLTDDGKLLKLTPKA